jgi:hypothetical protein
MYLLPYFDVLFHYHESDKSPSGRDPTLANVQPPSYQMAACKTKEEGSMTRLYFCYMVCIGIHTCQRDLFLTTICDHYQHRNISV